jgi:hypothetical protein
MRAVDGRIIYRSHHIFLIHKQLNIMKFSLSRLFSPLDFKYLRINKTYIEAMKRIEERSKVIDTVSRSNIEVLKLPTEKKQLCGPFSRKSLRSSSSQVSFFGYFLLLRNQNHLDLENHRNCCHHPSS